MTVETEVANLTTAVDNLTASVNVAKGTLDAKVSDAQTAEANAASHETDALAAKNAAETAAASAVSVVQQDLSAISADMPAGAVAICEINPWNSPGDHLAWMHDASKSWYQETPVTSTYLGAHDTEADARAVAGAADGDWYWSKGSKKCNVLNVGSGATEAFRFGAAHFAARWAVAYSDRVVLLDGDGMPWMVFQGYATKMLVSSATDGGLLSGLTWVGSSLITTNEVATGYSAGVCVVDFAKDSALRYRASTSVQYSGLFKGKIADRNAQNSWDGGDAQGLIVADACNDVAATVLPNAPADPDTGLPVPTIGVATDGGVSVIKDDGSVVDITGQAANVIWLDFTSGSEIVTQANYREELAIFGIPDADVNYLQAPDYRKHSHYVGVKLSKWLPFDQVATGGRNVYLSRSDVATGLNTLFENPADPASGMVAYQSDDYATPPMFGDVKGAFLCERGAATLVGANYASETFTSGLGVVSAFSNGTPSRVGNELQVTADSASGNGGWAGFAITTAVGQDVKVRFKPTTKTGTGWHVRAVNSPTSPFPYVATKAVSVASGEEALDFVATASTTYILIGTNSDGGTETANFDYIHVDASTPDRSVNGKGAIINGTLTRDADGFVNGWDASNYIESAEPIGIDPTDEWTVISLSDNGHHCWALWDKSAASQGGYAPVVASWNSDNAASFFRSEGYTPSPAVFPKMLAVSYKEGAYSFWYDGKFDHTHARTFTLGDPHLIVGARPYAGVLSTGISSGGKPMRGVVVLAGVPSAHQIRAIANWKGDVIEGTIHDLSYVAETKSLWVLTSTYLYEIGPDGAERSKHVNDISATTLAAFRDGYLVS